MLFEENAQPKEGAFEVDNTIESSGNRISPGKNVQIEEDDFCRECSTKGGLIFT